MNLSNYNYSPDPRGVGERGRREDRRKGKKLWDKTFLDCLFYCLLNVKSRFISSFFSFFDESKVDIADGIKKVICPQVFFLDLGPFLKIFFPYYSSLPKTFFSIDKRFR